MTKMIRTLLFTVTLVLIVSCSSEPTTIVQTVVVESTVAVPVTVEVTRIIEIPIEKMLEVEVTRQVLVEVTRLVELVATATHTPTVEPTPNPTATYIPENTPRAQPAVTTNLLEDLLEASREYFLFNQAVRGEIRGLMDSDNCTTVIGIYEEAVSVPTFDVSSASPEVQNAHAYYLQSVEQFLDAMDDIADACRNAMDNQENFYVNEHMSFITMRSLNLALGAAGQCIQILESLLGIN